MRAEIQEFASQLVLARGLSENTRAAYERDLEAFGGYLSGKGSGGLLDATRQDIVGFLAEERGKGRSDATISRRLMALRTFYAWLAEEGAIKANPAEAIGRPRSERKLPESLTENQTAALIGAFDGDSPTDARNRAMLEMLYATGLRASELVSLTLDDVSLNEAFVRCRGKGYKERVVPLGARTVEMLAEYISGARASLAGEADNGALFPSKKGGGPVTRKALWAIVVSAARRSGIWGHVHPHTLRHCFATHLLAHGAGIRAIQEMLGHADIATTQIYTHVDESKILAVHRKFHPRR